MTDLEVTISRAGLAGVANEHLRGAAEELVDRCDATLLLHWVQLVYTAFIQEHGRVVSAVEGPEHKSQEESAVRH